MGAAAEALNYDYQDFDCWFTDMLKESIKDVSCYGF